MNEYNFNVKFEKGRITSNLKKLVQNDYNSTKINFTFDKEGRKVFKMLLPDGTPYVTDIENDELIFGKGVLSQDGTYEVEIALYTEDGRLTDYATIKFEVRAELIQTDEIIELDDRLPILDTLIQEVTQIKNDAENGAFDGEDGITPTIGGNGNWFIGMQDTGMPSQGAEGKPGPAGGVSIEEVKAITGELENLSTKAKDNLVNAINEVASNSGIPHLENETITLYNHQPGLYLISGTNTTINYGHSGQYSYKPFSNNETTGYLFCVRLNAANQGYGILFTTTLNNTTMCVFDNTTYKSFNLKELVTSTTVGSLSNLQTSRKNNIVNAINEVFELTKSSATIEYVDDAIASAIEELRTELGG